MTIKINKIALLGIIVALCVAIYLLGRYGHRREVQGVESALNYARDSIKTYSVILAGKEMEVAEKEQLILSLKETINQGIVEREALKKLHIRKVSEVNSLQMQINVLLDSIQHTGTIVVSPCIEEEEHPALYLPFIFKERNDFLDLKGEFDENANLSMQLKMPLNVNVITGYKQGNKNPYASIITDNPYVSTINVESVKIEQKKRWYDSKLLWFGGGVLTSATIVYLVK